jgi:hypothetical protein
MVYFENAFRWPFFHYNFKMHGPSCKNEDVVCFSGIVGRDSSVVISIRYRLRSGGRIPVGGEIFRTRLDRPWFHPASSAIGTGFFLAVKRPGRGVDHPPPSIAEVKERVELYLYPTLGLRVLF